MSRASNKPVAMTLRLYRALANAFPHEFKNVYGDELLQVTEDAIEPIWRQHGVLGLMRLLLDIAIRVPAEHGAELWQDVRYGLRMLRGSKGFTAVALISLGLGIAVATSAFSEMNAVILRRLPGVPQPDQLVALQPAASYPAYQRFRQRSDLFSAAFAYVAPVPFGVWLDGHTERIWGHLVTPSCFSTLGALPVLGRAFEEGEDAVVVSYRFWQNRLGSDSAIVGKTIRVNGHPFHISGVAPKQFLGAAPMYFAADLWLPVSVDGHIVPELAGNALEQRDRKMFQVVGRLRPGVTEARAEAELDTVARQLEQAYGEEDKTRKGRRLRLAPGGKMFPIRSDDLPMVTVFPLVLVSLVLLIACSNVANMMLARAAGRRKEIAVRLALGASRSRLIRQLLTESMLVAAGAGVVGFILAVWLMHLASQVRLPFPTPVSYDMTPDGRVLVFTLILTVFTGVAFGLVPALQATRTDLAPALKEGGNVRLRRYRRLSLRNLLVVSQVAGSLALLLITGFLVLGFQRSTGMDVGFSGVNLYLISLDPIRDGYSGAHAAEIFEKLLDRVKALPGVTAATLTDTVPMSISGDPAVTFSTPQANPGSARVVHTADKYVVGKDYFDTLGIPILLGRGFRKEDEANDRAAVIVTEKLVQAIWSRENAVGRRIEIGSGEIAPAKNKLSPIGSFDHRPPAFGKGRDTFEVVGVVKDIRHGLGLEKPRPAVFFPLRAADYASPSLQGVTLMVRARGGDVPGAVRREIQAMDAKLTPFNGHSMTEQLDHNLSLIRMAVWTYGSVGIFGLILAAVGLAGVTAYSVAQRGREIGIRVALGAGKGDVLGLVMKEGAALVMVGSVIGLACAWGATRVLSAFMSAISRTVTTSTSDPVLLFGAPVLLAGLALAACYLPARKSMGIDPAVALRQE